MIEMLASYIPFRDPLWNGWNYWYLLLLPLAFLTSLIYKGMRVDNLHELPGQTGRAFVKFIGVFLLIALVLWVIMLAVS